MDQDVEHETSSAPTSSRCGHCGSTLRADAPWCTLCLTPTAPGPAPQVVAAPPPAPPVALDPLTAPLDLLVRGAADPAGDPSWPCTTCETPNPLDAAVCTACGAGFLDVVRLAEPPLMTLPLVGDVSRLTKGQLLGLAFAFVTVVLTVTLLVGVLLG